MIYKIGLFLTWLYVGMLVCMIYGPDCLKYGQKKMQALRQCMIARGQYHEKLGEGLTVLD